MKKQTVLFLSLIVLIGVGLLAFKSNSSNPSYSYLVIRTYHPDMDEVSISIGGKEFKKINLSKQYQGGYDMNALINLINQYENEGWEMQYIRSEVGTTFVWMRREK
jgi:hypothetical protein